MKKPFNAPKLEVVVFESKDIIVTSVCDCDNCPGGCPEGYNNCPCVDSFSSDYKG